MTFFIGFGTGLALGAFQVVSQVTNQAPKSPSSNPVSGLEMANQNAIVSLNTSESRIGTSTGACAIEEINFIQCN